MDSRSHELGGGGAGGAGDLASVLSQILNRLDALEQKLDRASPTVQPAITQSAQVRSGSLAGSARRPRVVIVEDDAIYREGLRSILEDFPDEVEIVGEATSSEEAAALVAKVQPDVALVDLGLPARPDEEVERDAGLHLIPLIRANSPKTRVLVLTVSRLPRRDNLVSLFEALAVGANGYLVKNDIYFGTDLVDAVHQVNQGQALFGTSLAQMLLEFFRYGLPARLPAGPELDAAPMPAESEMRVLETVAQGAPAEVDESVIHILRRNKEGDPERFRRFMEHQRGRK